MTDIPADVLEAAHRLSSCTDPDILLDEITRILADRAAQAERMARLEEALRSAFCPRPCNNRPDDFEVGQCVDADECGCCLGYPFLTTEMLSARALSQEGSEPS